MSEAQQVIPALVVQAQRQEQRSLIRRMADQYGVDHEKLLVTLKNTAFRIRDGEVSNEQMMALLVVADAHKLNPFTREIFAFPSQNGVVPVVSVDGWAKLVNDHPQFNGWEFDQDDEKCTCTIFRKDREHPTKITEYMAECKRGTQPWQSHPKRMLRHKALIQAARYAFSFSGVFDPDEAEAIVAAEIDVTPRGELGMSEDTDPEKLSPKRLREVVEGMNKAVAENDGKALWEVWGGMTSGQQLFAWGTLRSWERTAIKKLQDATKWAKDGLDLPAWSVQSLQGAASPDALEAVWRSIQDMFAENDSEVPLDINTVYEDRKTELGV